MAGKMYRDGSKMRMDMNAGGHDASSIIDLETRTASSIVDIGMGQPMVTSVDLDQFGPAVTDPGDTAVKTGESKTVSGESCNIYTSAEMDGTVCITSDGIMMEAKSDGGGMTLSNVKRGAQPASLFAVPKGGMNIGGMDIGAMMEQAQKYQNTDR